MLPSVQKKNKNHPTCKEKEKVSHT
jgi:hypothetical protein